LANLIADQNFEDGVVDALIALGHDVITARAAGLSTTKDPDFLQAATAAGRIVLTHDHDFHKLHKSGVAHAGIVYTSYDPDFPALAARIDAKLQNIAIPAGQLIRVTRPNNPPQVP
jgi:hypothetical protein